MTAEFLRYGMELALREADLAAQAGEVPTGCVILEAPDPNAPESPMPPVHVFASAHNQTETLANATAHAEMLAIAQASKTAGDWRLANAVLFVTKEPCPMCAGAIVLARIPTVVYGLSDPKRGGQSVFGILDHPGLIHRAHVVPGVMEDICHERLSGFFRDRRAGLLGKPGAISTASQATGPL